MIQKLKEAWIYLSTWGPFALITMIFGSLGVLTSVLRLRSVAKRCIHWWAKASCWVLRLKPKLSLDSQVSWAYHLRELKQGVMIANHASHLDIILIAALAPFDIRILAKASLFKVPFLGWYLSSCGHIPVYRGQQKHLNESKGREAIKKALKEGATLLYFPEGTRSHNGQLKSFRSGAFVVAEQHGLTTYPLVVKGTSHLLRSGSRIIHHDAQLPCVIHFLPELAPLGQRAQDPQQKPLSLAERVKQAKARAEGVYQEAFTQD
ncbi:MAG: hypothetical protein CMH49_00770 [Myxococcales bacterium]|nr:hypothetical protein [Myxococcales bacterium]